MNYVTLVNNTIQESGADLVEFETDGSDWNSYANTDMKSRYKTWVKRAWRSIQQEAFDWEWMSEQAIVNCVPGIHFYSPDSITWNLSTINPFVLYDVDDSQAVPDKTAIKVVDLTGKYTNLENFGYVDLLSNNTSPLDFGLKAGGEYFNSIVLGDNASLALVGGDVGPSSDPYVAITGYPSILTAPSAGTTIVAIHLITAESSSPVNEKSYTVNGTTRNSTGSPSNEVLIVDFSDI